MYSLMMDKLWRYMALTWTAATLLSSSALADCECGYSVNATSDAEHTVYTDVIETNFRTVQNLSHNDAWEIQTSEFPYDSSSGQYGRIDELRNVISNPLVDNSTWSGSGTLGPDAGVQLWTRGGIPSNNLVPMGEIRTSRSDMLYGSIRSLIKFTATNGTCGAFFWYYNDTQEIDNEILSRQNQAGNNTGAVNLILQSLESQAAGYNAAKTPTFDTYPLPFDPSDGFHEYRFDWTPEKISFYADGKWLRDMTQNIPDNAGRGYFNHWSNGNPFWSGGPPNVDAKMTVAYFLAYFNSSNPARSSDYKSRCPSVKGTQSICTIPEYNSTQPFFFTEQKNMTNNQTNTSGDASSDDSGGVIVGPLPQFMMTQD
ncbi:uncharacterized protein TRUGW13939_08106 [Talaromyces rugulosus]|uniref:GH16 domain-containing protein n=1 Tax=Talaromyces rugulosus TaxID=121627 RepID=A0A7H8R3P4_TALRU|nr:uncharacterized protein TRUGW13939_08106 [Talaromyces rugulosus]QKX60960.1 hypothetical protein TRUGW13939_08106 [Talaromyces rugulosus]